MHVEFGLQFDALQPQWPTNAAGVVTLVPSGLLGVLETGLGLPPPMVHPSEAAFAYLQCLRAASAETDSSTARFWSTGSTSAVVPADRPEDDFAAEVTSLEFAHGSSPRGRSRRPFTKAPDFATEPTLGQPTGRSPQRVGTHGLSGSPGLPRHAGEISESCWHRGGAVGCSPSPCMHSTNS